MSWINTLANPTRPTCTAVPEAHRSALLLHVRPQGRSGRVDSTIAQYLGRVLDAGASDSRTTTTMVTRTMTGSDG